MLYTSIIGLHTFNIKLNIGMNEIREQHQTTAIMLVPLKCISVLSHPESTGFQEKQTVSIWQKVEDAMHYTMCTFPFSSFVKWWKMHIRIALIF